MKQVTWKQWNVDGIKLAEFLTKYNFQPGQFVVLPAIAGYPGWVTVVAVDKESK